jgi:hypothetical protein
LEKPDGEADEGFELHAGDIEPKDLIDELEDDELAQEEALEAELEEEYGIEEPDTGDEEGVSRVQKEGEDEVDVEASLDQLLLLHTVGEDELDEQGGWSRAVRDEDVIVPRRHRGEFLCRGCFLVKAECQLADRRQHLCRDCA